jgi:parallel beta-helix repeat protein
MYDDDSISWHVSDPVDCINNSINIYGDLNGLSNINAVNCPINVTNAPVEDRSYCGGEEGACSCGDYVIGDVILDGPPLDCSSSSTNGLNIVENNVTLDCAGNSIIGNGDYDGVYVSGKSITINNCTITGFENGIYSEWSGGTSSEEQDGTVITNNNIYDNWEGVFLSNDGGDLILGNDISGNADAGIVAEGKIRTWNNQIIGNNLEDNVYITDAEDFSWCDYCSSISLNYEDGDVIDANNITDGYGNGIDLQNSRDTQITGNYIADNWYDDSGMGWGNFQINVDAKNNDIGFGSGNTIYGNTMEVTTDAAISLYTNGNTVTVNTIDCTAGYTEESLGIILNYQGWLNLYSNGISGENISAADKQKITQYLAEMAPTQTPGKHKATTESLLPVNEHFKEYAANAVANRQARLGTSSEFSVSDSPGDGYNEQLYGNSFSGNWVTGCDIGLAAIDAYDTTVDHDTYSGNDLGLLATYYDSYSQIDIANSTIDDNCQGALFIDSNVDLENTNVSNNDNTEFGDGMTCDTPMQYNGVISFISNLDILNGNYENNNDGSEYMPGDYYEGIYDVTEDAYWLINQNVMCTNNDLYVASIVPVGGAIVPTNCTIYAYNSTIDDWQELNLSGGQIGQISEGVGTGPTGQDTVGSADIGIELVINTTTPFVNGAVDIAYFTNTTHSGYSLTPLGRYITLTPDDTVNAALGNMTIKMYYTHAEIDALGLDEDTLRIEYYNETSNTWTVYDPPNGGVDTVNNYVWAIVDHFSLFGMFGSTPSTHGPGNGAESLRFGGAGITPEVTTPATVETPTTETPATQAPTGTLPLPTPRDLTTIAIVCLVIVGIGAWYFRFGKKKLYA